MRDGKGCSTAEKFREAIASCVNDQPLLLTCKIKYDGNRAYAVRRNGEFVISECPHMSRVERSTNCGEARSRIDVARARKEFCERIASLSPYRRRDVDHVSSEATHSTNKKVSNEFDKLLGGLFVYHLETNVTQLVESTSYIRNVITDVIFLADHRGTVAKGENAIGYSVDAFVSSADIEQRYPKTAYYIGDK